VQDGDVVTMEDW